MLGDEATDDMLHQYLYAETKNKKHDEIHAPPQKRTIIIITSSSLSAAATAGGGDAYPWTQHMDSIESGTARTTIHIKH